MPVKHSLQKSARITPALRHINYNYSCPKATHVQPSFNGTSIFLVSASNSPGAGKGGSEAGLAGAANPLGNACKGATGAACRAQKLCLAQKVSFPH